MWNSRLPHIPSWEWSQHPGMCPDPGRTRRPSEAQDEPQAAELPGPGQDSFSSMCLLKGSSICLVSSPKPPGLVLDSFLSFPHTHLLSSHRESPPLRCHHHLEPSLLCASQPLPRPHAAPGIHARDKGQKHSC